MNVQLLIITENTYQQQTDDETQQTINRVTDDSKNNEYSDVRDHTSQPQYQTLSDESDEGNVSNMLLFKLKLHHFDFVMNLLWTGLQHIQTINLYLTCTIPWHPFEFLPKILTQTLRVPELLGGANILLKSSSLCLSATTLQTTER